MLPTKLKKKKKKNSHQKDGDDFKDGAGAVLKIYSALIIKIAGCGKIMQNVFNSRYKDQRRK